MEGAPSSPVDTFSGNYTADLYALRLFQGTKTSIMRLQFHAQRERSQSQVERILRQRAAIPVGAQLLNMEILLHIQKGKSKLQALHKKPRC